MKNYLLLVLLSISLFSYLQGEEKNDVDLNGLILENPKSKKTEKDYEKKEDLLTPLGEENSDTKKKEDGIGVSGNVDINKEEKKIEGVHINLNGKF